MKHLDVSSRPHFRQDHLDVLIARSFIRLGGSSEQVARHQLGRGLSEASPYFLLLSATPHQGKSDAFHRLVSLLDKNAFPEPGGAGGGQGARH